MKNKKTIILSLVLVLLLVIGAATYFLTRPTTQTGNKTIIVLVVAEGHEAQTITIKTSEEFLEGALLADNLAVGNNTQYGLYITTVSGIEADASNDEWWCLTKNGEDVYTGAGETPIADGDQFELTLTVGY